MHTSALRQQLAVQDIRCGDLAVLLKYGDVLVGGLAAVRVEDCVRRNARSIRRTAVVDFADKFAAIVEAFHVAPPDVYRLWLTIVLIFQWL